MAIVRALAMEPEILLLDESTSALDLTMTGEVEAVIRRVAASGVTMMLVTHSMELAQRVSTRILYLDEGGIYEEGTSEEIFGSPQKERTRQFIYKLKVLKISVASRTFDFYGCNARIVEFCQKNEISHRLQHALMLLFEEICLQILMPRLVEPKIKWTAEYSAAEEQIMVWLEYNGGSFDIQNSDNKLSLKLICSIADILEYEQRETELWDNRVLLRVRKRP